MIKPSEEWLLWNRSLAVAAEGGSRVQAQYMMRDTAKNAVKKEVAEGVAENVVEKEVIKEAWKQGISLKNNPLPISSEAKEHLIKTKVKVKTNVGVSGAHNINEFEAALKSTGKDLSNMIDPNDVTEVPGFPGLKDIKYRVPIQDGKGNYLDSYKYTQNPKTVYDPSIPGYSDSEIYQYGLEAMENGYQHGYKVFGEASNGMKFVGYTKNGEITNFHPVSSFD